MPPLFTIGMEIETENLTTNNVTGLDRNIWRFTRDASVESDLQQLNNGVIVRRVSDDIPRNVREQIYTNGITVGTELYSIPMDPEEVDIAKVLRNITNVLQAAGEPPTGDRAGIHIHVCMPISLPILKSAIQLGRYLEDVFFYIGTQGHYFRGIKNDSIYCRPITQNGPPVVKRRAGGYAKVFDVEDLLEAKTVVDFWRRLGDTYAEMGPERYVAQRYTWLNLYSLMLHGTIEFRVFNKTLNPKYLLAEVALCTAFCQFILSNSIGASWPSEFKTENSIFDNRTKAEIAGTLYRFSSMTGLESSHTKTLQTIISRATPIKLPNNLVYTHLTNGREYWRELSGAYSPNRLTDSQLATVEKPNFTDIHLLRGERRS